MQFTMFAGACALVSSLAVSAVLSAPAHAQADIDADTIEVHQQLLTPSAGMMNDHMHEGGEAMIGLRLERQRYSGTNRSGTDEISDADVLAAGYSVRAQSMEMDMVMLDLMFAPTSDLTLMVMPHYMWHRMEMVGIDPANTGMDMDMPMDMPMDHSSHGGHGGMPYGMVHAHGTEGFGDTLVSASYRLARSHAFNAHATLGLWVPTGAVDRTNADGTFVHYGMQSGSGTWDIEPAVTVSGQAGAIGWGGQASYRWRTDDSNASGFAFGDKARVTGWLSYLLAADVGTTARLEWEHEGAVLGHYNAAHNHSAPSDIQANYGGDVISAAFGVNWRLPLANRRGPQLGAEMAVPIHQRLNGIQLPRDWRLSLSLAQTF
ncbi:transporter [Aurantiacibacter suaedae]|uniref:transporter n=1 Tax=Aurantiacibacter suaedae TaxID=2545755 RepID=UPI0010F4F1A8|nr:transporter [Aurantiacibacter suaedae]